jgi:hypothetical protein
MTIAVVYRAAAASRIPERRHQLDRPPASRRRRDLGGSADAEVRAIRSG